MRIKVLSDNETFVYEPDTQEFTIGRSSEADFVIDSPELSRKHCKVYLEEHRIYIEDLASKNGVKLDGKRISPNKKYEVFPETDILITKELQLNVYGGETRTALKLEAFLPAKPLVRYKKIKEK